MTKNIFKTAGFLSLLAFASCSSTNLCKSYIGKYSDKGQELKIQYKGGQFALIEGGQTIQCNCNKQGQLEIVGPNGPVVILLSDSAGIKRFCFAEDSLKEDCLYEMKDEQSLNSQ